ncbi:MAG: ferritin [Planctomycetota bacterium]|jgi:ferritin
MLQNEIEKALNDQINQELSAAQEYLATSAWFDGKNLAGFARFMRKQAEEERQHALKLFDHMCDRGGTVQLGSIAAPPAEYASAKAAFDAAWERERANTSSIHALFELAEKHHDLATRTMLLWFIEEQVEEEQWCEEAVGLLEMVGNDSSALLMLDQRYGQTAAEEEKAAADEKGEG